MTLVVGTDLDPQNQPRRVARLAGRMALATGDDLLLVHVSTDPRASVVLGTAEEALLAPARGALDGLAGEVRDQLGVRVEADLWAGSVPESLSSAAESVVARALVLAEPGPRSPGRLFGTTVERVVREARSAVIVARDLERLEAWLAGDRPLRVLVGSDTGESAARALRFVRDLAAFGATDVTIACVADPEETARRYGVVAVGDGLSPEAEAALRRDLSAQAARAGLPEAALVVQVGAGAPEAQLAALARALGTDLVVVGVRKRSWIEEVWHGSVANGVLRGVETNVACVPRTLVEEREPPVPSPEIVLAATDLSPIGDAALPVAYGYVAEGGTVHLVHVLDAERVSVPGVRVPRDDVRWRLLDRVPPEARARRVSTEIHVVGGETAEAIVALAEQIGAGAICIGTVGRSGLGAAAFGSVSREVVAAARCPVIVVPR